MSRFRHLAIFLFITLFSVSAFCSEGISASSKAKKKKKYDYNIAICAIFQNEARWLKEWIEFHQLIGVQRFYLYNNLSSDNFIEVLQPYIDRGIVHLKDWPYRSKSVPNWTKIQSAAYKDAVDEAKKDKTQWLAIIDLDEFIVPVIDPDLTTFLKRFENYDGIVANWQMYGTSFVPKIPADKLMIEMLVLKAPEQFDENSFVKSIVKPSRVSDITDPHYVRFKSDCFAVNTNGRKCFHSREPIVINQIRINHYWSRDEEFFYSTKCPRRQNWMEGFDGQLARLNMLNQVEDRIMQRFVLPLRQRMGLK